MFISKRQYESIRHENEIMRRKIEMESKFTNQEIADLSKRVYELENPSRITEQNIKIQGDTIYFNGHGLSFKPPVGMVNLTPYRENDTVEDAIADENNIYVTMKSGDKFTVMDYAPFTEKTRVVKS